VDDKDINDSLMSKERWNDPATEFLTKKSKSGYKFPKYQGPTPPPNRFGILPGYRWDGVDRSNGFEKEYFKAKMAKESVKEAAYKWAVEDM